MLFNSLEFLLFLPLVWCLYWLLRNHLRIQNTLVVIASYIFYGWWDWHFLILIAFTSCWSYVVGIIELYRWRKRPSRFLLAASLIVNLGILGYFKYYNFFLDQAVALLNILGFSPHVSSLQVILPVGISFYTFQALSYSIDVYRRQILPTRDPITFFAFISFFPQLVAGPIERATNLLPQFLKVRTFDYSLAVTGCRQMLWGFFKKMVVADNCAIIANYILNSSTQTNGLAIWLGVFLFTIQIYGDFSGYSDIAIGCSRLFGIELRRNFAFPYFARDIAEFWRRWHMSLTTWFRDYLYIPLGGSRCSRLRQTCNTFIIFLVSGFWHGANWTFIFWGIFHALLFLPLLLLKRNRRYLNTTAEGKSHPSVHELLGIALTFFGVVIGWTFFRAQSIGECLQWFRFMFDISTWTTLGKLPHEIGAAIGAITILITIEWLNRCQTFGFSRLPQNKYLRWLSYYAVLMFIVLYSPGSETFVYFQF